MLAKDSGLALAKRWFHINSLCVDLACRLPFAEGAAKFQSAFTLHKQMNWTVAELLPDGYVKVIQCSNSVPPMQTRPIQSHYLAKGCAAHK